MPFDARHVVLWAWSCFLSLQLQACLNPLCQRQQLYASCPLMIGVTLFGCVVALAEYMLLPELMSCSGD